MEVPCDEITFTICGASAVRTGSTSTNALGLSAPPEERTRLTGFPVISIKADSNYGYGLALGEIAGDLYREIIPLAISFIRLLGSWEELMERAKCHALVLEEYYPEYLDRLKGPSSTIEIDPLELLAIQCNRYITTSFLPLIGWNGLLNDKGLAFSGNTVATTDTGDGLTCMEIVCMALERCSNVHEVVELMESLPIFTSSAISLYNLAYLWADAEGGIASVECTHNYFAVNYGEDGILAHTNHHQWLDRNLTGSFGPEDYPSSYIRLERAWELLREKRGSIDLSTVKEIVSDRANGISILGMEIGGFNSISCHHHGNPLQKTEGLPIITMLIDALCSIIIQPKELIIHWCMGHPDRLPFIPIYCAELLGVNEGGNLITDLIYFANRAIQVKEMINAIRLAAVHLVRAILELIDKAMP